MKAGKKEVVDETIILYSILAFFAKNRFPCWKDKWFIWNDIYYMNKYVNTLSQPFILNHEEMFMLKD